MLKKIKTLAQKRAQRNKRVKRENVNVGALCRKLDSLVERAEELPKWSIEREALLARADVVREQLRAVSH